MENEKWRNEQISHAREKFKEFKANFTDLGEIQTLDWRNVNGSSNYYVRYVFDKHKGYMYISGDLGSACFYLTWNPTLENTHNLLNNLEYILGKVECSTDKYLYPDEYVRSEVEEYYNDLAPARDEYADDEYGHQQYLTDKEEFWETIEAFIQAHDHHYGFQEVMCEKFEELQEIDEDWYEHEFGRCISTRVYCWFVGLEMAWEQLKKTENSKSKFDDIYFEGYADGIKNVTTNIVNDIEFALTASTEEQRTGIEIALDIIKSHISTN